MIWTNGLVNGQNGYTIGESIVVSIEIETTQSWTGKWELLAFNGTEHKKVAEDSFDNATLSIDSTACLAGQYAVRIWFIFANGNVQIENIKIKLGD